MAGSNCGWEATAAVADTFRKHLPSVTIPPIIARMVPPPFILPRLVFANDYAETHTRSAITVSAFVAVFPHLMPDFSPAVVIPTVISVILIAMVSMSGIHIVMTPVILVVIAVAVWRVIWADADPIRSKCDRLRVANLHARPCNQETARKNCHSYTSKVPRHEPCSYSSASVEVVASLTSVRWPDRFVVPIPSKR